MRADDCSALSQAGAGRLVAVVVTFNRLSDLQTTLSKLLEFPKHELANIVVVNNASTDGTDLWLAQQSDPRLDILTLPQNMGGAGGFEAGMKRAVNTHFADWVVVMDDDARPLPGAFAAFHNTDLSQWDAAAAAVYYPGGEICDMNRPSRNPFWHVPVFMRTLLQLGRRSGFHLGPRDYESGAPIQKVDITSFVGFFISRAAIERIGYPDPSLFVYGDDGVYTLTLSESGGRIGFLPGVQFEHDCSTFTAQDGRFRPLWKVYYYYRNLLILYRKAAGWFFWPALLIIFPKWLFKLTNHKGEYRIFLRLLGRAISDGLRQRTSIAHEDVLKMAKPK